MMRKNKLARLIGAGGATGLGILVFILLSCPNLTSANAVEYFVNESDAAVQSENAGQITKVYVKPSISIALANAMEITADKEFNSNITDIKVATNSERGFKVLVNAATNTNLVETADSSKVIPTIATAATAADFPNAGWGYYVDELEPIDSSKYLPVSTTATVAKSTSTSGASNTLKLSVGVKAGPEVSVGTYQNTLIVSAIANPIAISTLYGLTYMQEMTPEICAATKNYVSTNDYAWKTLTDMRVNNDGTRQSYRVAKLADGNCWMQENLRLDLNANRPLTPSDSDVTADRTLPTTLTSLTNSQDTKGKISWAINNNWYYQWNAATAGSGASTGANNQASDSICPKGWKLPLSGINTNNDNKSGTLDTTSGSFRYLFNAHGVTTQSGATASPLFFVPIGAIQKGAFIFVDTESMYWARMLSTSTDYAYFFDSTSSALYTSDHYYPNYNGFFVRCVTVSN